MTDVIGLLIKLAPFVGSGWIVLLILVMGPALLVAALWYWSNRSSEKAMAAYQKTIISYREDTQAWRREAEQQLSEQRRMYEANVELVKGYAKIAEGMQDLIVLNTKAMTNVCKSVEDNQYCPMVRLKKETPGRVE
jgi:hypothetical protein